MNQSWTRLWLELCSCLLLLALSAKQASAIPAFARRYNLKCTACHTVPPVLNEQGYMFKRLGFHLPPSLTPGEKAPAISYLVHNEQPWSLTNNVAFSVADFSYQAQRTTTEGASPSSTAGFQVNYWNGYFAGWIPDTNFFYFAEFDIVNNGSVSPDLPNAYMGYAGGNAHSSWILTAGRENLQTAEGTRAATVYSLLPSSPLLFENLTPTNFVLDQSPVGVEAGYTWASSNYRNIFAATAKVTNGDNADGSELLSVGTKNSKDVWLDLDWWYAPESGVSFVDYYGTKDQIQNSGLSNQFTYLPHIRRQGIFGNYMLATKLDFLGGYLRNRDDWEFAPGVSGGSFTGNDFYGEIDYYLRPGLAFSGRYDLLRQRITSNVGIEGMHDWTVGVNDSFTRSGNIIGRIAYSYLSGRDPLAALKSTSWLVQADIAFNF